MNKNRKTIAIFVIGIIALFIFVGKKEGDSNDRQGYTPSNYSNNWSTQLSPGFVDYFGGTTTTTDQSSIRQQLCPVCYGSGSCQICNGKGWIVGYNGEDYSCSSCNGYSGGVNDSGEPYGDGRCSACNGTGFY